MVSLNFDLRTENQLNAGIHSPRCTIVTSVNLNLSLLSSQLLAPDARIIPETINQSVNLNAAVDCRLNSLRAAATV